MSGAFDLDVDTTWIRRAAVSLDETARSFGSSGSARAAPVTAVQFGGSEQAAALVDLVNLRAGQTLDAAAQLSSIAAGLAQKLMVAAEALDRAETSSGTR